MNDDLAFAGPDALGELIRAREATPREVVELFLARIERLNPRCNAFRSVMAEQALAQADASEHADGALAEDVLYSLAGQLEQSAPSADRRPPGF